MRSNLCAGVHAQGVVTGPTVTVALFAPSWVTDDIARVS